MDIKGEWHTTEGGVIVPASAEARANHQTGHKVVRTGSAPTEWITARATLLSAIAAVFAVVVSLVALGWQVVDSHSQEEAKRQAESRTNASRVQVWQGASGIIVQNGSPAALTWPSLVWRRETDDSTVPERFILAMSTPLEPCTRWTSSTSTPKIQFIDRAFRLDGVLFLDSYGGWMVDTFRGAITGPDYAIPAGFASDIMDWDSNFMRSESISGCSISP
jgi:hypothetical protein